MNLKNIKDNYKILFIIFVSIFFVYLSALTSTYIQHDDFLSTFWTKEGGLSIFGRDINAHPYYGWHNALGRALGHSFVALTNYFVVSIEAGNTTRFFSLILLSIFCYSLYNILIRNSYPRFFSLFFALSFSVLPVMWILIYQITGIYIFIGLIYALIFMNLLDNYLKNKNIFLSAKGKFFYLIFITISIYLLYRGSIGDDKGIPGLLSSATIIFFIIYIILRLYNKKFITHMLKPEKAIIIMMPLFFSYHIYTSAAGFSFFYLIIYIFNSKNQWNKKLIKKTLELMFLLIIPMIIYFITVKYFNLVDSQLIGRQFKLDFNILEKITFYFNDVLPKIFNAWFNDWSINENYSLSRIIAYLSILLVIANIVFNQLKNKIPKANIIYFISLILISLGITIASSLFVKGNYFIPARTLIAHVSIIYFLLVWSIWSIFSKVFTSKFYFSFFTNFIVTIALLTTFLITQYNFSSGITYPLSQEIAFISNKMQDSKIYENLDENKEVIVEGINFHEIFLLNDSDINNDSVVERVDRTMDIFPASGRTGYYLPQIINSFIYENFKDKKYISGNHNTYKQVFLWSKTGASSNENYIIVDTTFNWGKTIQYNSYLYEFKKFNNNKYDHQNIMYFNDYKRVLAEWIGNKNITLDSNIKDLYVLTIDMREFREKYNKEILSLSKTNYFNQMIHYLRLY